MQLLLPPGSGELSYDDVVELYDYPPQRPWIRANFVSTLDGAVQGTDFEGGFAVQPGGQAHPRCAAVPRRRGRDRRQHGARRGLSAGQVHRPDAPPSGDGSG
ncbi:MAG: hypothetical protein WKF82_07180 [Nocardioidaceae bacterium]